MRTEKIRVFIVGLTFLYSGALLAFQTGVVKNDGAEIKESSNASSKTLETLNAGAKVSLSDKPVSGFYRARSVKTLGWIDANAVQLPNQNPTAPAPPAPPTSSDGNTQAETSISHPDYLPPHEGHFHKSIYFNLGLGYAIPIYPSAIATNISNAKAQGVSEVPIAFDLGLYFPVGSSTLLGPAIHGANDSYSGVSGSISIIHTGLYASVIHSFSDSPGTGFFLRADAGLGVISLQDNIDNLQVSATGLGALGGLGYAIPVSEGCRITLGANFSTRLVQSSTYSVADFTLGVLF